MSVECICVFLGSRNKQRYFYMEHRLTDLFITQAGLVYCALRGEYSIFFVLSRFTYFLLFIAVVKSAGESVVVSVAACVRTAVLARSVNHRFILHVDTGCPASRFSRFRVFFEAVDQHVRFSISKAP